MSVSVKFEATIQEGYSDQRARRRETVQREATMTCVPRVGDTVETGYGAARVSWVDWSPWNDSQAFVRLDEMFTLAEPWVDVVVALTKEGWT